MFGGTGKVLNKEVKLHIDPDVTPRQQPHRRIPFHVREDVEKELKWLEKLAIIETVEGPTPWISPIVVVPKKSGEVRICVDMREANKAIKREKHLMPPIDDLIADLNGATHFSTFRVFTREPLCHNLQYTCWTKEIQTSAIWNQCSIRNLPESNKRDPYWPTWMLKHLRRHHSIQERPRRA